MATLSRSKQQRGFKPTKVAAPHADERKLFQGGSIQEIEGKTLLVVTDAHMAIRLPIQKEHSGEELSEGYIPAHALRLIERSNFRLTEGHVEIGRARSRRVRGEWIDGEPLVQLARIEPGRSADDARQYPSITNVWPEKPQRALRISLDTKLLRRLADGLATDAVTLEIGEWPEFKEGSHHHEGPIVVWAYGKERPETGPDGLLMPMRERVEAEKPETD
jgi:hypothetical protein